MYTYPSVSPLVVLALLLVLLKLYVFVTYFCS